jgi:hypothetical protein
LIAIPRSSPASTGGVVAVPLRCRSGPRSSALILLYEALHSGEPAEQVLARAEREGAPFVQSAECRAWLEQGLRELAGDGGAP